MSIFLVSYFLLQQPYLLQLITCSSNFPLILVQEIILHLNKVRWTAHVKPSIGGISFFIIFLLSWGIYGFISQEKGIVPDKQIIGIVAAYKSRFPCRSL
jgi:hypothetical protein